MNRFATFVVALATVVASLSLVACGSSGSALKSPTSPTPALVMAPPPAGVSAAVWRVAFVGDRLYRPEPAAVHLDLSAFGADIQGIFAEMASVAADTVQQKTTFDLTPGGAGATFVVSVESGLLCNGNPVGGCTSPQIDSKGRVLGGTIKFSSLTAMRHKPLVLHEIFRTLGLLANSPAVGIMAGNPWNQLRPTDEERLMFLGRYNYPLLAVYTDH